MCKSKFRLRIRKAQIPNLCKIAKLAEVSDKGNGCDASRKHVVSTHNKADCDQINITSKAFTIILGISVFTCSTFEYSAYMRP